MNPEVTYQAGVARIDDLHRQADAERVAAEMARGRRRAFSWWRRRGGSVPPPSFSPRYA